MGYNILVAVLSRDSNDLPFPLLFYSMLKSASLSGAVDIDAMVYCEFIKMDTMYPWFYMLFFQTTILNYHPVYM